jgi:hypothetical protein
MKTWIVFILGLALMAGVAPGVQAQPAAPAPPPQAAAAAGLFAQCKEALAALKDAFCKCCFGQLINNSMKPLSAFTGCPLTCCPDEPSPADLAKPGEEGAAAQIKKDELECKARRAAVRYLGTVDCHYWYDVAEPALIGALRGDRCECVRLEAALALGRGCCCTKRTMAALLVTVNGSEADGNVSENSERVKAAAAAALAHCLSCFAEVKAVKPEEDSLRRVSLPPDQRRLPQVPTHSRGYTVFYNKVQEVPLNKLMENAKQVLAKTTSSVSPDEVVQRNGGHSVYEIVMNAMGPNAATQPAEAPLMSAPPAPQRIRPQPVTATAARPVPSRPQQVARTVPNAVPAPEIKPVSHVASTEAHQPTWHAPAPAPAPAKPQAPAPAGTIVTHRQMLALLRDSAYPEQREWAAEHLHHFDWKISPEIVDTLLQVGCKDRTPAVRLASIRCLVRMNVATSPVAATVQAMKADNDPRVRAEADLALVKLGFSQPH